MADVIVFPLKLRSPEKGRLRTTEIVPFPFGRRRYLVSGHARAMADLNAVERESYLNQVLDVICSDLRAIGIDCEDCECEAMLEFLGAMGRELHGPGFVVEPEEVAQ
jgi:hypothetical protein